MLRNFCQSVYNGMIYVTFILSKVSHKFSPSGSYFRINYISNSCNSWELESSAIENTPNADSVLNCMAYSLPNLACRSELMSSCHVHRKQEKEIIDTLKKLDERIDAMEEQTTRKTVHFSSLSMIEEGVGFVGKKSIIFYLLLLQVYCSMDFYILDK